MNVGSEKKHKEEEEIERIVMHSQHQAGTATLEM